MRADPVTLIILAGAAVAGYLIWMGMKSSRDAGYTGSTDQPAGAVADLWTALMGPDAQQKATATSNANVAFGNTLVTTPTQAAAGQAIIDATKAAIGIGNTQTYDTGNGLVVLTPVGVV